MLLLLSPDDLAQLVYGQRRLLNTIWYYLYILSWSTAFWVIFAGFGRARCASALGLPLKRALRIISLTTITIVSARYLLITWFCIHRLMTTFLITARLRSLLECTSDFGPEWLAASISCCWNQFEAFDFPFLIALPDCGRAAAELGLSELLRADWC